MHCQPYMIEAIATLTMGMSMFIFDSLSDMSSNDKQNASFPCQNCRVVCAILFHFFRSPTATCLRDPIRGYMVSLIHQNQAEWYMTKFHPTARREYQRLVTLNADSHKQRCHRRPVIKDSSLPILHVSSRPTCVRLCGAVIYHIPILIWTVQVFLGKRALSSASSFCSSMQRFVNDCSTISSFAPVAWLGQVIG